jgi:SAM-dependent methyltransferase
VRVLSCQGNDHSKRILEIGPGSGFITQYLIDFIKKEKIKATLDLCDISNSFLARCGGSIEGINKFIEADICAREDCDLLAKEAYDIILFEEALEHTVAPYSAIYNISSSLAEGGNLILTVPNTLYARRLFRELNPFCKLTDRILDTHIAEMTPLSIVKLLSMSGFDVVDISYYRSKIGFASRLISPEVGFICKKSRNPKDVWNELTSRILTKWK